MTMDDFIYLDNAATTPLAPEAAKAMAACQASIFGNPSSSHSLGVEAAAALEKSRRSLAGLLACSPDELVFTAGGTEADNLALFGAAYASRRKGLVISAIEHPAVLETADELARRGYRVRRAPVDSHGIVLVEKLLELVDDDTFLVSVMYANNEVGSLQPVRRLAKAVKKKGPGVLFHSDAVQAFGREPISLADGALDLLSISAHKLHGPRGAGALYVKKGTKLRPLVCGGGQEMGLRSGTENVVALAGFAAAAELLHRSRKDDGARIREIIAALTRIVIDNLDGIIINGHPEHRLPEILSLGTAGLKSQNLLHFLEDEGVLVSAGSACHSTRTKRSHVIEAMGVPPDYAIVRISASRYTTPQEAEEAGRIIVRVVNKLRG